jgi:hypothetical protein
MMIERFYYPSRTPREGDWLKTVQHLPKKKKSNKYNIMDEPRPPMAVYAASLSEKTYRDLRYFLDYAQRDNHTIW